MNGTLQPDPAPPLIYHSRGRTVRLALIVGAIWIALGAAWLLLDAAGWIMVVIGTFTLPALWDLWSDRRAGMELTAQMLRWSAGRGHAEIPLQDIDYIRLDTRLDMSVRATVYPKEGRKVRLPYESTPPHMELEARLNAFGIRTERHHFSLMQ